MPVGLRTGITPFTARIKRAMSLLTQLVFFSSLFRTRSLSSETLAVSSNDSIADLRIAILSVARRDLRLTVAINLFSASVVMRFDRVSWSGLDGVVVSSRC